MWLKFPQSAVASGQKAILSSARQGTETTFGGVELLIVNGELRVHFKQSWGNKRWRVWCNITEQYNKWMHITGTWSGAGLCNISSRYQSLLVLSVINTILNLLCSFQLLISLLLLAVKLFLLKCLWWVNVIFIHFSNVHYLLFNTDKII